MSEEKAKPEVAPAAPPKPPYVPPAGTPVTAGPAGFRFDFNQGARLLLPPGAPRTVRLWDRDTNSLLFRTTGEGLVINSSKRFFVRFRVELWDGPDDSGPPSFTHDYDARDRKVLIQFPVGTLGDSLAWFPYAARFAEQHGCRLTCSLSGLIIPLLRDAYPHITFITPEELAEGNLRDSFYASYCLGLFFEDPKNALQPTDFRLVGLHRTAGYILGVDPSEMAPAISFDDPGPPIDAPYVCIAVQSSTQCKYWNNPDGWRRVVAAVKAAGFRVVCIDQKPVHGQGIMWNHMPHGVEDETGNRPLTERARWLRHAAFFIGTSSGLAWLAWAAGTPVVMISGFTHPTNEFTTPYRVINWHACNSCWNDPKHRFDHKDFLWCPRHAGTPRQFECSRLITAEQVLSTIARVPAWQAMQRRTSAATPTPPPASAQAVLAAAQ
ncbi:autotransporter strand-loop-strand O-heptosyltransferase [Teichococcus deserti]|uniref:autotransporter strand-loop-strand O-heptosyltransferase n=1 Tax=Teichococcus deserti TaxID=1817963 RepID=UPI0009F9F363|nr:autotransporter strand-loop-strand O-heptosyltransferase [Pseudoroseomonas deserti]